MMMANQRLESVVEPRIKPSADRSPSTPTLSGYPIGPVLLAWGVSTGTLALQAVCTNSAQLAQDAAMMFPFMPNPAAQHFCLYVTLWALSFGSSAYAFPKAFPAQQSEAMFEGQQTTSVEVPHRSANMKQHQLRFVDYTYVVLNSLCIPGLFYHFICLCRSFGLDFSNPPMFGIYPDNPLELLTYTIPHTAPVLALYFLTYEFFYYWWHRAMHEIPMLYKWVHKQ